MSQPIIEVRNVSKKYRLGKLGMTSFRDEVSRLSARFLGKNEEVAHEKDFWALKGVSFNVQPGEVVGLIGRNGAGKSTMLKILSRITAPTAGEIVMRGRLASLLEVGTGFHPELSGRENVFLNGAILGMKRSEIARKFDEIVAFSEIEKFIDTPVKRYSSGMYVRLAFSVAAHLEPDILVVDEVLAVGDSQFQSKCIGKMHDVSTKHGRTVLFVSHNIPSIRHLCSRVVWMKDGRNHMEGDTRTVIEKYLVETLPAVRGDGTFENEQFRVQVGFVEGVGASNVQNLLFGSSYVLECKLGCKLPTRRGNLIIEILDANKDLVSSICSKEEGIPFVRLDAPQVMKVYLNKLQLYPGSYSINCHLFDSDTGSYLIEALGIFSFQVNEAHIIRADIAYNNGHGYARICDRVELSS